MVEIKSIPLKKFKVAWENSQTILAIQNHVISSDTRIKISNPNVNTWILQIKSVTEKYEGR